MRVTKVSDTRFGGDMELIDMALPATLVNYTSSQYAYKPHLAFVN